MRIFSFFSDDQRPAWLEVEYHARFQIPTFQILGLPAPEIQEARERIMAAFIASDWEFPKKKVIVNLTPASVRKSGTAHDLAIALKIYTENEAVGWPENIFAWGELALDGSIKPGGRMPHLIELLCQSLHANPVDHLILSSDDFKVFEELIDWRNEHGLPAPDGIPVTIVDHLNDFSEKLEPSLPPERKKIKPLPPTDLSLLPLSPSAERILKISIIGKHHLLLLGPKGIGKSESLKWFQALLPPSHPTQVWERLLNTDGSHFSPSFSAPIRQVHAQVKPAHLLGSYHQKGYQAGELALSHGGLFIADEFMEWPRDSKECLREPLQSKKFVLTRVRGRMEAKCDFQFVATGNLCPCGGLPPNFRSFASRSKYRCRCRPNEVQNYLQKLSGPILDRIDLTFLMTEINQEKKQKLVKKTADEIKTCQAFALQKFGRLPSELDPLWLEENCPQTESTEKLLADVLSLRSRHKIMRVARSIQALELAPEMTDAHLFEAKMYRLNEVN